MKYIKNFTDDDTRFLSNFYPYKKDGTKYDVDVYIVYNNIVFDCVENAYQAAKFLDIQKQKDFSSLTPYETKEYWIDKTPENQNWEYIKLDIMKDLVFQKFNNSQQLKKMLIETGNAILEEGNTWNDTFWGICDGKGQNHLGKILMDIRENF